MRGRSGNKLPRARVFHFLVALFEQLLTASLLLHESNHERSQTFCSSAGYIVVICSNVVALIFEAQIYKLKMRNAIGSDTQQLALKNH